jgi:hypothetical protein
VVSSFLESKLKFDSIPAMPSIDLRLTHSVTKLQRWREELTGIMPTDEPTTSAATYIYHYDRHLAFIVYMTPSLDDYASSDAALLAHEAVHVAQSYFENIGEDDPASEEFAYIVQGISEYLIAKHFKWKQKRLD